MNEVWSRFMKPLEERLSELPDKRTGSNQFIKMKDIGLSAFSVFFTQCASFLEHQRAMQSREGQNNGRSLFHIEHIPSDSHIRAMLDEVPPGELFPVFFQWFNLLESEGALESFRSIDGTYLVALDGLHYFQSEKISCDACQHAHHEKTGKTSYFHSLVSAVLVHPDSPHVLPLIPSFVEPQVGHEKQDCEREATKRWCYGLGAAYAAKGVTLLGDDLYSCQSIVESVVQQGFHFIFVAKPTSHKTLYEWVDASETLGTLPTVSKTVCTARGYQTWHCRYLNQVPLRDKEAVLVNWCEVTIRNQQEEVIFRNSTITDFAIDEHNVMTIVKSGRARWKIENEHNNTLKNQGYLLEHNFGHGHRFLAMTLVTMIFLSFFLHTALHLLDEQVRALRKHYPRVEFFRHLRLLLMYAYFGSWSALTSTMVAACQRVPRRRRRDSG